MISTTHSLATTDSAISLRGLPVYISYSIKSLYMHVPYEKHFTVHCEQLNELASFLEQTWLKGEIVAFWQLEELFVTRPEE